MSQRLMKQKLKIKCLLILCVWLQLNTVPSFAIDGNGWRELPEKDRSFYIMGAMDMMNHAVRTSEEMSRQFVTKFYKPIINCVTGRPYSQIIVIVEKHIKDTPEDWPHSMASNIWTALDRSCKK